MEACRQAGGGGFCLRALKALYRLSRLYTNHTPMCRPPKGTRRRRKSCAPNTMVGLHVFHFEWLTWPSITFFLFL